MTAGEVFPLPGHLLGDGDGPAFLLRVNDDSMAGVGITRDDWVIVRQGTNPVDKTIVAGMIDGNATVRTYRCPGDDDIAWLQPHDLDYPMLPVSAATILGTVTVVIHRIPKPGND